jgi:hypothetical protein
MAAESRSGFPRSADRPIRRRACLPSDPDIGVIFAIALGASMPRTMPVPLPRAASSSYVPR